MMSILGISWSEMRILSEVCGGRGLICRHGHFKFVDEGFERSSQAPEVLLKKDLVQMRHTPDVCTDMIVPTNEGVKLNERIEQEWRGLI